jgi:AAA15 family ATPase/GTPase
MEHIDELKINGFCGLRDLKIEGLGQINLFVGNNNSGKTSVLEALSLFCDPLNLMRWYDVGSQREAPDSRSSVLDRITWLFAQGVDPTEESRLSISASGNTLVREVSASYEKFDELETSIHTEALEKTFEWLVKACIDNNVQLLATTHSLEALDIIAVVSREIENFVVYRLQQEKELKIAKRFDKDMVLYLREELGMDLR